MKMLAILFLVFIAIGTVYGWLDFHVVGTVAEGDSVTAIVLDDSLLYASNGSGGVFIANISNPTAPYLVVSMPSLHGHANYSADLFLYGDTLLVIDNVLSRYDISNPLSPVFLDSVSVTADHMYAATHWSDTVAIVSWNNWIMVDFSDILAPVVLGFESCLDIIQDVTKAGDILVFESEHSNRVFLFDISVPTAPLSLGIHTFADSVKLWGVRAIDDTLIFLGGGVLNIADPLAPILVSVVPSVPGEDPWGDWCTIINDTAYMANPKWRDTLRGDLLVVDLTDPTTPVIIGEDILAGWRGANAIAARNDTVFLGYYELFPSPGVVILARGTLDVAESPQMPLFSSMSISPNPFNSSITISLDFGSESRSGEQIGSGTAAAPEGAEIEIFDMNGRMVDNISVGEGLVPSRTTGDHKGLPYETIWSPDDNICSGVYLVRAKIGGSEVTKRVVYLK
jgi:hypothetical protein